MQNNTYIYNRRVEPNKSSQHCVVSTDLHLPTNTIMRSIFSLILLVAISSNDGRELSRKESNYVEISKVVLEKSKPIEVDDQDTEIHIKDLRGTLYSDSFSKLTNVSSIKIISSELNKIEPGAICSSPSLKKVEIDFSLNKKPPVLNEKVFEHCENLEELFLAGDHEKLPKIIESNCLQNLEHLEILSLKYISIGYLNKTYFKGLKSLSSLRIERCFIDHIDPDAFKDLEGLQELDIRSTSLNNLPKNLFKHTTKLTTLTLTDCNITDLTWDEFEGLSSLKELRLYSNRITYFDADKVAKYMPNLVKLNLDRNPIECKSKELFIKELKEKLNHEIEVSYKSQSGYYDSCE